MSHMIPIVSSSPPPFDDSYGWDDGEDDDFGNFTGADDVHMAMSDLHTVPQNNDMVNQNSTASTPQKIFSATDSPVAVTGHIQNDLDQNLNKNSNVLTSVEHADSATNGNINFAQFDIEDVDVSTPVRPHIVGLPLVKSSDVGGNTETPDLEEDTTSCESATLQESKEPNKTCSMSMRDSTTDSGMFSNDISPIPKSEDTAEFCDKASGSDSDEPFPDLPPDSKLDLTSSHSDDHIVCSEHLQLDTNGSSTSDSKVDDDESDKENRTKSPDVVNEDSVDIAGPGSLIGCDGDKVFDESVVNEPSVSSVVTENEKRESDESRHCPTCESTLPQTSDGENDTDSVVDSDNFQGVDDINNLNNQVSNDVDHPKTIMPDAKPDSVCDDNVSLHSKDLNNSTEEQIIHSVTDLSQDTRTLHSVNEHKAESSVGSTLQNLESVQQDSEISTDISAQSTELSHHHSDQDLNKMAVDDNDTDFAFDTDHYQSASDLPENQCTSENTNNSAKPSSDTYGAKSEDNADNSFGGFAAFSTSITNDGDDAGEDDWASFQSIGHCENTSDKPLDLPSVSQEVDDEDDDFGDFIDNVAVKEEIKISTVDSSDQVDVEAFNEKDDGNWKDEEWANFEEPQGSDGEFSQFESKPASEPTTVKYKDVGEKLAAVLSGCFQTCEENSDMNNFTPTILEVVITQEETQQADKSEKRRLEDFTKKIWNQLIDLDKTPALVYQWNSSSGNSNIFKTLRIDTQNILLGHKKQSVPIFASNMGLLEPIRGPVDTKKEAARTEPALVDPSKVESSPSDSQDIPPVEFDWHNSGLTNPLAAKTLDLDFLTEQESESAGKTSVFQSEILDAPRTSVKSLPPLEDVLKNVKLTTTTKSKKSETLNPEAQRIIDSLPLLSFMHAKVLMFPFRQDDN